MKTKVSILVVLLFMVLCALPSKAENKLSYTTTYSYSNLTIGTSTLDENTYTTIHYNDLNNLFDPGKPSLPVDYIKFSVPWNATNFSVSVELADNQYTSLDHLVYPCSEQTIMNDTASSMITIPDSSAYYSNTYYPSHNAWIVGDGFFAGENRIVTVAVMPISFLHRNLWQMTSNILRQSKTVKITLNYILSDSSSVKPIIRMDPAMRRDGYIRTQRMVVNSSDVIGNAPNLSFIQGENPDNYVSFSMPSSINDTSFVGMSSFMLPNYDYLIITPDSLKASLKRLSAFKSQKGYHVGIVTVEEIISNDTTDLWYQNIKQSQMNDSARIIREYLKYAYNIGIAKFVLMSGKDVPFKFGYFKSIPTDHYYIDLTSDWEYPDLYSEPELFVGRIIAKTTQQISNYTDKLLRYEINPGNGDYSYLKKALYTNGYDQSVLGDTYTDIIRQHADSIFPNVFVMEEDRNSHTPTGTQVINQLSLEQYGFVSFNNHGIPLGLVTYGRGGPSPHIYSWLWALEGQHAPVSVTQHVNDDLSTGNGLDNMKNRLYPSICFSTACSIMPFDVMPEYDKNSINFGESFTTGKDYGGPAFVGNTRDNGFEAATLERKMLRIIAQETSKLGEALALGKAHSFNSQCNMLHNLLGDPEFEVWTDIPQLYTNIDITRTNNGISINGIDSDSTIVAYYSNDGQIGTDTISTSSVVFNNISPNSTVMLYKHNYIPYIAPLDLQNITFSKNQYVIASDVNAGEAIDSQRTNGNVIVPDGIEYEIEASGRVTLQDGFQVEKGATFAVYPSSF